MCTEVYIKWNFLFGLFARTYALACTTTFRNVQHRAEHNCRVHKPPLQGRCFINVCSASF